MGNGMNKILPGLYIGNFRDAKDITQLEENKITHVLSIHDMAKPIHDHLEYLCLIASDNPGQELKQFFPQCIDFIHKARTSGGSVLVHCLAGVSRSVTLTVAYLMTETMLGWRDALNAVRGSRRCANPNFGFQKQLMEYEYNDLQKARKEFNKNYPNNPLRDSDTKELKALRDTHWQWVLSGDEVDNTYALEANAYKSITSDAANKSKSENDQPNTAFVRMPEKSPSGTSSTPLTFQTPVKQSSSADRTESTQAQGMSSKSARVAKNRGSRCVGELLDHDLD